MQALEEAMAFSREMIKDDHELVPRFDITCEDGVTTIFVQVPDDIKAREERMSLVQTNMKVKLATSFVFATELAEPDAHIAAYVGRDQVVCMLQHIKRNPVSFGSVEQLSRDQMGKDIPGMLPCKTDAVSRLEVAEVEAIIRHNDGLRFG